MFFCHYYKYSYYIVSVGAFVFVFASCGVGATMSYCYFHGIVPVSAGRRVQTVRGNGSVVWHTVYDSMFYTESREVVDGAFRTFSPASESLLPDDSLLIAYGKFAFPFPIAESKDTSCFMIDSLHYNLFVLDPTQENYDSFLPVDDVPSVILLGSVVGSTVQMGDGAKAVDVRVSVYIQAKTMDCIIRCVLCLFFLNLTYWCQMSLSCDSSLGQTQYAYRWFRHFGLWLSVFSDSIEWFIHIGCHCGGHCV